jgi:uncharacterized protein (TIGR03000 family)
MHIINTGVDNQRGRIKGGFAMFNIRSVVWVAALLLALVIASEGQAQQGRALINTRPQPAQLAALVPNENMAVLFNGAGTSPTDGVCRYDSPPLIPGSWTVYTVKALWNDNGVVRTATRYVKVTAGSQVVIDFTQSPAEITYVR